jgi:hypothetical protein
LIGQIVTATKTHALMMAPHVRAAEVREIADSDGLTPVRALIREVERSVSSWAWIVDGEVACMFGIVAPNMLDYSSYPWMITTPLVERHWRQFARSCKELLPELLEQHPRLTGMVDARYELSVRWLQWLGARLGEVVPYGAAAAPFRSFEIGG